jgi:hypothetical protein
MARLTHNKVRALLPVSQLDFLLGLEHELYSFVQLFDSVLEVVDFLLEFGFLLDD